MEIKISCGCRSADTDAMVVDQGCHGYECLRSVYGSKKFAIGHFSLISPRSDPRHYCRAPTFAIRKRFAGCTDAVALYSPDRNRGYRLSAVDSTAAPGVGVRSGARDRSAGQPGALRGCGRLP